MSTLSAIDFRDNSSYVASVALDAARPEVTSLVIGLPAAVNGTCGSGRVAITVPDNQVMVKSVAMRNGTTDITDRVRFELAQCLLEPEDQFRFDIFKSGIPDRFTGLIYRRELLDELLTRIGMPVQPEAPKYLARAAALGIGYKTFCLPEGGELQCVADLTHQDISLCFLYHGSIASLAWMSLTGYELTSDVSLRRLAREFKSLVNFKLARLAEHGVTIPLSVVVLTGESVSNQLFDLLSGYFPIGVASPRFNRAYLTQTAANNHHPELFLAALGAGVN